ncbi:hypothetical protein C477_01485 [Haloterrigena salina JCM 13891]|uniref:Uncharacterized protein n=2 Tax=Haloterrigena salina TaxID=504937 RepID=M0CPM2_9EURY|nr:hypothetical protein C477_01485 [Haloterrigena salina JCM 13891]
MEFEWVQDVETMFGTTVERRTVVELDEDYANIKQIDDGEDQYNEVILTEHQVAKIVRHMQQMQSTD